MLEKFLFEAGVAALLVASWYFWVRRTNHRRSIQILRWIDCAFSGHAAASQVRWRTASLFQLELQLAPSMFRSVSLTVQLEPREMPLNWLLWRLRREKETVTFEAVLEYKPSVNLHVHNHRWCARTLRKRPQTWETWQFESLGPVVISTRENWNQDIGHMLEALLATRSRDFLHLAIRKKAPHFLACAPLQSLRPDGHGAAMFDVLHELASTSSTSRH